MNGSKFDQNNRIAKLAERSHELSRTGKRNLYADNEDFLIYHFSGESPAWAPATGEFAKGDDKRIMIGDRNSRVSTGEAFPWLQSMPSKVNGFEYSVANWAEDFVFFVDHFPAEIYENETIVGEFHWTLDEARTYRFTDEIYELGVALRELGGGGINLVHTCPDLSIGLNLGWTGLLEKVERSTQKWQGYGNMQRVEYLNASAKVVRAIIRYVRRHADAAAEKAASETDASQRALYTKIADNCRVLANDRPRTFEQALQWIQFYQMLEAVIGHGNGTGRLDQYLIEFYEHDIAEGVMSVDDSRNLLAELFLKYGGSFYSVGGKDKNGKDATNAVSWRILEVYDMIGGYNHLGLMWHEDIDKAFYAYGCDVLSRHGCGVPTLVSYDVMKDSELYSGYSEEDAWNVSYSGCQWYCSPGNEYCEHDLNCIVLVKPMQRAIDMAIEQGVEDFDTLFGLYSDELNKTADALVAFKNKVYEWHSRLWPEMVPSLVMHGPIEKGLDLTDPGSVNYAYTSVNILGVPNVVDSLFAIKKVVFEDKKYTLRQVRDAALSNWKENEIMRKLLLKQPKFGNDLDDVDEMFVRIANNICDILAGKRNIKGFSFRASLFQFMGHTYAGKAMGATPDGRWADEPLAHGCNPMHGRNTQGITATANSLLKVDFRRFQGGSLQIELQPKFFDGEDNIGRFIENFSIAYMRKGGVQINLNVINLEDLKDAISFPEKPEYQDIVVKVTGYSAHFVLLDKEFQNEFVQRVNYDRV